MAFFRKADAKVRLFFEPPKLFEVFLKISFFSIGKVQNPIFVQYFNSSAFLSRKRVQNYCFTTYLPNVSAYFFALFCNLFAKSLICSAVDDWRFWAEFEGRFILHLVIIRACVCTHIHITLLPNPSPYSSFDEMDGFFIYIRTFATITATLQQEHITLYTSLFLWQIICNRKETSATHPWQMRQMVFRECATGTHWEWDNQSSVTNVAELLDDRTVW